MYIYIYIQWLLLCSTVAAFAPILLFDSPPKQARELIPCIPPHISARLFKPQEDKKRLDFPYTK